MRLAIILACVFTLSCVPAGAQDLPSLPGPPSPALTPVAGRSSLTPTPTPSPPPSPSPSLSPSFALRVPILMYHYIRVNPDPKDSLGFGLSVPPAEFEQQLGWLQRSGFTAVTFDDLHAALAGRRALPARPVVLTFDDGYADFYSAALPALARHQMVAIAYLVSGFLGRPGYLTRAQARELPGRGVVIGSHTVSHVDLTAVSAAELGRQLTASRADLEELAGTPVLDFCYPSGRFSAVVQTAVAAAGYRNATTTRPGASETLAERYAWPRIRISGGESLPQFAAALGGP